MTHIMIVAEIGCNHNGDKNLAYRMIDEAVKCGVDAVKFQTFKASALISKYAPKAEYQKVTTGTDDSQLEMTARLELGHDDMLELKAYAESKGLVVFSTPFDLGSVDFLESVGQRLWKIPSGEITNLPYLEKIGVACPKCGKEVILLRTRKGRKYYGCENSECDFMSWNKPSSEKCPKCGGYMVEKGNKLACANEQCGYVTNYVHNKENN